MKQIILYDSATGNTEYLAKALSHALPNVPCGPVGSLDCSKAELVYLGFWTGELPQNCTVIGWYMCPGRMGEGVRRRYEAMLQDPVSAGQAELLLKNFDAVRTRPDERDAQALLAAAGL